MNSKCYKCCAVPQCTSTSIKTPNKLFVHVPNKKLIRKKWLKLARRNPNDVVTNSPLYFCEDHFDMPNDMENYMQYHVMKSVSQVRMKPGCMPHKFTCQSDRKSRTSDTTERPYIAKKRRMMILEECKKEFEEKCIGTKQSSVEEIASISSVQQNVDELPQLAPRVLDKSVQVNGYKKCRSKANQTKVNLVNQMTSPSKLFQNSVSTSPFQIKHHGLNTNPSRSSRNYLSKKVKKIEHSDSEASYTPSEERNLNTEAKETSIPVSLLRIVARW
ncbi:uncharacterized protein LOC123701906 [Colias croceus]|uniref:uncharacterized protein LOC123701906 n=1 Tax=Colias crocea TaxID=72248 RepID=UPI001E280685|nr:uncharacterized protein LOC123701906 [Colias croceus]